MMSIMHIMVFTTRPTPYSAQAAASQLSTCRLGHMPVQHGHHAPITQQLDCTCLAYMCPKKANNKYFVPKTISEAPWSYRENLELIFTAIPELQLNKHTYIHTRVDQ